METLSGDEALFLTDGEFQSAHSQANGLVRGGRNKGRAALQHKTEASSLIKKG